MALIVAEFFTICGVDQTPPETMAELIPWLLTILVALVLVSGVFRIVGGLAGLLLDRRKWL